MKWFRHETDSRQDFKLKRLAKRFGMEGYGVYWAIIELLAFETKDNLDVQLSLTKFPVDDIAHDLGLSVEKLVSILDFMAEVQLIDPDCYASKVLCCKALAKRADDYAARKGRTTKVLRSVSGETTDIVPLQERTEEDRTKQEKTVAILQDVSAVWNRYDFVKIVSWSPGRKEKLAHRLKDTVFRDRWREAIERLGKSDFATGKGPPNTKAGGTSPWRASIDWFLENDTNYVKALEGKYDNQAYDKYARRV